ncbi:MAG: UDP-N-acetylmuramoyl-tripeptide--D-alanyl-D-alanine ligase, partial [Symbiobacteriaceae bacterium]|nr:UDP-N-acetylmuramoyl-tripeptide--D-alanyl-D-alanine ligase [Symbiobacteriaceae bacterium]
AELNPDYLITRGELARGIAEGAHNAGLLASCIYSCRDNAESLECLRKLCSPQALILVKGSRGMQMEQIIQGLEGK